MTDQWGDLVDFRDEPRPCGAASGLGHSAGGRLRGRTLTLRAVCLLAPMRSAAEHMSPQGPLPALGRAAAPPAAGGIQTEVPDKPNTLRWNEESDRGDEVAGIPDPDGIPDGGIEIGGVANCALGR